MSEKIDKKDLQLLYWLDVDGRMTLTDLGKKLGMSKQLVKYRIERLEARHIIKGYYPLIDTSRMGYTTIRVYLKLRNATPAQRAEVIKYCKAQPNIWAVILIAGKWDIALGIAVADIYEFYTIWEALLSKHLPHIREYKTAIYSPIYHYAKAYLLGRARTTVRVLGGGKREAYDETDKKILRTLTKNARMPLIEIAKHVGVSPELTSFRLKQLVKRQILQGYRAMIDVQKLGYEFYKAEIRLSDYERILGMITFCEQHPNIYQVDKTIGGELLEVEFHVKSLHEMLAIIGEFEKTFPNCIESYDYITIIGEEKTTYMPADLH